MVRLTAALISAIHDGADITTITSLIVPSRDLDQLVGLEVCERLKKLDLSDNRLSSLEDSKAEVHEICVISSFQDTIISGVSLCTNLQWLSVASNQLTSLKGVEKLMKLAVLNASRNELTSLNEVATLKELRALILNDNEISTVCRLDGLVNLNTIVLSHNPIRNVGNFASKLPSLKKLSLSHCQVQVIGQSLQRCVALEELRLAHNQLSSLPQELERNGRLTILDIGTNHIRTWSDVQVLSTLRSLVNLNLRGNPLSLHDGYEEESVNRLPYLHILDGHPFQDILKKKSTKKANHKDVESTVEDEVQADPVDAEGLQKTKSKVSRRQSITGQGLEEDIEDRPFINLISFTETQPASKTAEEVKVLKAGKKSKKRKDDSGVISIFDVARRRPGDNKSSKVEISLNVLEVGSGGPSTWDDSYALNIQTQDSSRMLDSKAESRPYSRWALKKKK